MTKKRTIYDKALKDKFLHSLTQCNENSIAWYGNILYHLADIEDLYEIPIYKANADEYQAMLMELSVNTSCFDQYKNVVDKYVEWCCQKDRNDIAPNANTYAPSNSVLYKYFRDHDDFLAWCQKNFPSPENDSPDIVYQIAVELIYLGVIPSDLDYIKKQDVDFDSRTLIAGNRKINLPERLVRLIMRDQSLTSYVIHAGNRTYEREKPINDYLLNIAMRSYDDNPADRTIVTRVGIKLSTINQYDKTRSVTPSRVFISGAMDRAIQLPDDQQNEYLLKEYVLIKDNVSGKRPRGKESMLRTFQEWKGTRA